MAINIVLGPCFAALAALAFFVSEVKLTSETKKILPTKLKNELFGFIWPAGWLAVFTFIFLGFWALLYSQLALLLAVLSHFWLKLKDEANSRQILKALAVWLFLASFTYLVLAPRFLLALAVGFSLCVWFNLRHFKVARAQLEDSGLLAMELADSAGLITVAALFLARLWPATQPYEPLPIVLLAMLFLLFLLLELTPGLKLKLAKLVRPNPLPLRLLAGQLLLAGLAVFLIAIALIFNTAGYAWANAVGGALFISALVALVYGWQLLTQEQVLGRSLRLLASLKLIAALALFASEFLLK